MLDKDGILNDDVYAICRDDLQITRQWHGCSVQTAIYACHHFPRVVNQIFDHWSGPIYPHTVHVGYNLDASAHLDRAAMVAAGLDRVCSYSAASQPRGPRDTKGILIECRDILPPRQRTLGAASRGDTSLTVLTTTGGMHCGMFNVRSCLLHSSPNPCRLCSIRNRTQPWQPLVRPLRLGCSAAAAHAVSVDCRRHPTGQLMIEGDSGE